MQRIEFGPDRKKIYIFLPYTCASSTLHRHLVRLLNVLLPSVQLIAVFRPSCRLLKLSKLKSPLKPIQNSNVVYKISCSDCPEFYVGKTNRILKNRILEHSKDINSALFTHSVQSNHCIAFNDVEILDHDINGIGLLIREALHIKEQHAENSLNRNVGSFRLQLW